VAGRYQPLADDVTIAGDVRPNLSSAVNQKTKEIGLAFEPDFLRLRRRYDVLLQRSAATAAQLPAFATGNRQASPAISG
jgi:hypothetical protein